jgi:hypothetical protein
MCKVIIESPRGGSFLPNYPTRLRIRGNQVNRLSEDEIEDLDLGPNRIGMSIRNRYRSGYDGKSISDLLGPLKRFLHSRVGRVWNDVHSEISQQLDNRSLMGGRHVWTHVWQFVSLNCYLGADGLFYELSRYGHTFKINGLFVHPESLILSRQLVPYPKPNPAHKIIRELRKFGIEDEATDLRKINSQNWRRFRIIDDCHVLEFKHRSWFMRVYRFYEPHDVVRFGYNPVTQMSYPIYYRDLKKHPDRRLVRTYQLNKKLVKKYFSVINRDPLNQGSRFFH